MDLGCDWLCGLSTGAGRPRLSVVNFCFREQRLDPFGELGFGQLSVDGLTAGGEAVFEGVAEGCEGVLIVLVGEG